MSKITAPVSRVLIACLILTALPRAQVGRHVSQSQGTDKPTDIGAVEVLTDTQETDVQPCLERMVIRCARTGSGQFQRESALQCG